LSAAFAGAEADEPDTITTAPAIFARACTPIEARFARTMTAQTTER